MMFETINNILDCTLKYSLSVIMFVFESKLCQKQKSLNMVRHHKIRSCLETFHFHWILELPKLIKHVQCQHLWKTIESINAGCKDISVE